MDPYPLYYWNWFSYPTRYNCLVEGIPLLAKTPTDVLFVGKDGPCTAIDTKCIFSNAIIIWNTEMIHTCEFSFVLTTLMQLVNNTTLITLNNQEHHLLLELVNQPTNGTCDTTFIETSSGFMVTKHFSHLKNNETKNHYYKLLKLELSDVDKSLFDLTKIFNERLLEEERARCHLLRSMINLAHLDELEIKRFWNHQGNDMIIYKEQTQLYSLKCFTDNYVHLINMSYTYYKDIPISLPYLDDTYYLNEQLVIRKKSISIPCSLATKTIILNQTMNIQYKDGLSTLIHNTKNIFSQNEEDHPISITYTHDTDIIHYEEDDPNPNILLDTNSNI